MISKNDLQKQREVAIKLTASGVPARTVNPFFGVGPITNMTTDEVDRRLSRFEFEIWLEKNYQKLDDQGQKVGPVTTCELDRCMHRGYPADKVVLDMMREIHRYFEFPKQNKMAVGLGGGHSGFTVAVLHLMNTESGFNVFVDTPKPESEASKNGGAFRQSWGVQLIELQKYAEKGDENRIHFSTIEGHIPSADDLQKLGINLFVGVGHETTGATTYAEEDVQNLLEWIDLDPGNHHAVIDATSTLGAMPWTDDVVQQVVEKCCLFMPFQKAIGGTAGYFIVSFTPEALKLVEINVNNPAWAIPRQLKLALPTDGQLPISGNKSLAGGPFYDPEKEQMTGGIINTFSTIAFAETTFGLLSSEKKVGSVRDLNKRSIANRAEVEQWVSEHQLFELGVEDSLRRGAAVTLLKVNDDDINDAEFHTRIIAKSKQLLGFEGLTHPNGDYEHGLDVARYINTFPGTPGDFRLWIGGMRPVSDIRAVLDNLEYAYHRAKIVVIEEELAKSGVKFEASSKADSRTRKDDLKRSYKVLIADLVGLKFDSDGDPDPSQIKEYIEEKGGVFHKSSLADAGNLETGKIHFFYQPDLSRADEILPQTDQGQYDALIAAATFFPKESVFNEGGVRIGAGTGNMGSASWGGGNGTGGSAPLMNTPSFNSRATAHMAFKALLKTAPDLDVSTLHKLVVDKDFDTGKQLKDFPTEKIEGKRIGIVGSGNIGREVAKIAQAFNMEVVIHARPKHKQWIESEGFIYAPTIEDAANGADFISFHTGLGAPNQDGGKFENEGLIGESVLNSLNDGAVLINYDRGEVVNALALDKVLSSGKVRYAAIDADIFKNTDSGEITGPMAPYLDLEQKHPGKLELLPHAAADTEHVSRVEGAKQAVDQIFSVIQFKTVINLKGDLPEGYKDGGANTVLGVGKVTKQRLSESLEDPEFLAKMRRITEEITAIWGALSSTPNPERREELIKRYGSQLILASNTYASLIDSEGLKGPYVE
ncbi:MAG: NAD(P)-dependent oxidoreductase [SAR324 cluster bacterium]|nr:NAD(P)-dependent oxidoreductase [SAR324 cluster bacterium]